MDETKKPKVIKWIEEAEEIKVPTRAAPRRTYDEKLVAYIDILGMSDLVSDTSDNAEEILTMMAEIQTYVKTECGELVAKHKLDYIQIGDGFVIVTDLRQINRLCRILANIQWRTLVYSKMLLRGAITAGRVKGSTDEGFFIGPAIIEAYKLERENAIFPRIIYMNEIENYVSRRLIRFNCIAEDQDKIRYLDFIKHSFENERLSKKTLDHLLTTQGIKRKLKNECKRLMDHKESQNKKIAQKYGWLISKFASYGIRMT
jgi:hypothetical protein